MTPAPIRCPHCGSYDVEWLNDEEIRCLDCGRITRCPPGLIHFARREKDLEDKDEPQSTEDTSWDDVKQILD